MPGRHLLLAACLTLLPATDAKAEARASILERIADIPIQGSATRFDYQSIDTTANRLYVSRMGAGELVVIDLVRREVVGTASSLPRITGVCAVPALGKVYASVPGHHQVVVLDPSTLRIEARVGHPGFPDGIAYAPPVKKVYVSDESGAGELVIDGTANRVVRTIPIGGEAGNTLYDPPTGHVLVAVQTRNEVVEIDPRSDRLIARHELPGADHPHGMAIDASGRRLFVASEASARLQVVDLRNWGVVSSHEVGEEPDVLAYDPGWRRLYVGSESGVLSVFRQENGRLVEEAREHYPHAHTVSVDARTHLVYLPLQDVGGHPLIRILSPRRP